MAFSPYRKARGSTIFLNSPFIKRGEPRELDTYEAKKIYDVIFVPRPFFLAKLWTGSTLLMQSTIVSFPDTLLVIIFFRAKKQMPLQAMLHKNGESIMVDDSQIQVILSSVYAHSFSLCELAVKTTAAAAQDTEQCLRLKHLCCKTLVATNSHCLSSLWSSDTRKHAVAGQSIAAVVKVANLKNVLVHVIMVPLTNGQFLIISPTCLHVSSPK